MPQDLIRSGQRQIEGIPIEEDNFKVGGPPACSSLLQYKADRDHLLLKRRSLRSSTGGAGERSQGLDTNADPL